MDMINDAPTASAGRSRWVLAASAATACTLSASPAHAITDSVTAFVDSLMATYGEALTSLGFSGLIGYCAGKAVRVCPLVVTLHKHVLET